jgi:hypothetical protein
MSCVGNPPSSASGGPITPGTYTLAVCSEPSGSESEPLYHDVLQVTGTTIQHAGSYMNMIGGEPAYPYADTWGYTVQGTTLHVTPLCSNGGPFDIAYSADSHSLILRTADIQSLAVRLPYGWSTFTR